MEKADILRRLQRKQSSPREHPQSQDVRTAAVSMISEATDIETFLQNLLFKVLRPLFLTQNHPNLTATGRKRLVPDAPSTSRYSETIDWDDEKKIWRNGWTCDLLAFIILQYRVLPSDREKATFESQFHLLIPPILNLIDDGDIQYKTQGCRLLRLLCEQVTHCQSDILKRTGLSDVFSDALKTNFLHLPTLTPEEESLTLLSELYPAFRALVDAHFPILRKDESENGNVGTVLTSRPAANTIQATGSVKNTKPNSSKLKAPSRAPDKKDKDARQAMLDLILRHGILASYAHAVDYVRITTLLLHEASLVVSMMGIYSAKYLQILLPLLRNVLCNPFGTACVSLLMAALECMEMLIKCCWPRVKEKWWGECLRAIVGCWVQIADDEADGKVQELRDMKDRLGDARRLLEVVVGEEFIDAKQKLVEEDEIVRGLFEDEGNDNR